MGSEIESPEMDEWRFTWESQSQTPTLRLLLLFPKTLLPPPSLQTVRLHSSHSFLLITLSSAVVSLRVPIPARVLLDADAPPTFRALSDHIEVKLLLLLPLHHPILSALSPHPSSRPLPMDSDVENLASHGEVDFYCRTCAFKLTKHPLRNFVEMPSANWREVADNWFGACCCSFGGVSEKLVLRYVNSHTCAPGICLLSPASVILCKDDLVECNLHAEGCGQRECGSKADNLGDDDVVGDGKASFGLNEERTSTCADAGEVACAFEDKLRLVHPENEKLSMNFRGEGNDFSHSCTDSNGAEDVANTPSCCAHSMGIIGDEDGEHHLSGTARKTETIEIRENQKPLLNGFLEDVFMARLSNLSKDIDWHEFTCPQCMSLLGAYPCCEGYAPVDGGVRLFKCYISTCVPVGGSEDIFSEYTMDKMFANQLMGCATDESSFRFVVRDLATKSPVLQIILLNPDTWSCSGNCSVVEDEDPVPKLQLRPIIKVLFSDFRAATESQLRMIEEWATKNSAEIFFMLSRQIQDLMGSLMTAKDIYPPSYASYQGLILSSVHQ
ncbi:uncharacterized protein LOC130714863 [Lotus japonicus]|uniref:uncharacterized protein LOC130714863 n=1 Tax=Lotus japonicus TaxID=34305 RepID=UPI0025831386|nr:uncharacterized protein LOC130714863 [Lotus japonicus]